ncbi:hypothetical protein [Anaerotignum lactatifermentans]|uniref:hypothetical protein n=1 Tax=Anaerotignum lactatifermentans TaxID=160404 RepID=UPI003AB488C8
MKFKTTQREIRSQCAQVIAVPYCRLQTLLCYETPTAYTTRREGWGADIYIFESPNLGEVAIATGYAPFGNISPSYELNCAYEERAQKIRWDYSLTWKEQKQMLHQLVLDYIAEVKKVLG